MGCLKPISQCATQSYAARYGALAYYVCPIGNIHCDSTKARRADPAWHCIDRFDFYPCVQNVAYARRRSWIDQWE